MKPNRKSKRGIVLFYVAGTALRFCIGDLDYAGLEPPALAAFDAIVLSCSFSQVLVHCSPEFSETCCIDIQGLFLIPITALSPSLSLSVWLPPLQTPFLFPDHVQDKWP